MKRCGLYIAHMKDKTGVLMSEQQITATLDQCQLKGAQKTTLREVFSILLSLKREGGSSAGVYEQVRLCMESMGKLPYTARLIELHRPTLVDLSLHTKWTPGMKNDWAERIQTLLLVLCNNFGYQVETVKTECDTMQHRGNERTTAQNEKVREEIHNLLYGSSGHMAEFMLQGSDASEPTLKGVVQLLKTNAVVLLDDELGRMMRQFKSEAVKWRGLELMQHALYMANREFTDVQKYGYARAGWEEVSSDSKTKHDLSTTKHIAEFLLSEFDSLSRGKYNFSIPTSGIVLPEQL